MKKLVLLFALVACTFLASSALVADLSPSQEAATQSVQELAGLPTTVLDQVIAEELTICFRDFYCLDVYDPVICSNGVVYSNGCYAARACATGCVPFSIDS
ncbi:MAG: hypothetical protein AAF725_27660 [Acidobacteriota bacterium]